jgi:DNA repair protein SbcC/Rad50
MIIESIELRNIKSYDDQGDTITFRPGVNLIWGKNGSGKTTILEAIGYCLFDALEYNLDQFRREGETGGEVTLTFKHSDERSYAVIRDIRVSGGLKIQDVESGRFLFKKRKDAEDWLNDELGVEFGEYGKHLFQNAIGVSQGKMIGAFVVPAGARKKIFDPILRVDEYDQAYKQLADTRHLLNDLLKANQIDRSLLKGRLEQLPSKKKDHKELTDKILAGEREMGMMRDQRDSLQEELTSLNQILSRLVELDNAISSAEHNLSSLSSQLQTIGIALDESKKASKIVAFSEKGHKQYEQANEVLAILEARKSEYDQIQKDIQAIKVTLSGLDQEISDLEKRLDEIDQAERKISNLEPEVQKQSNIEKRIAEAKDQVKERERLLEEIMSLENQIEEKKSSLQTLHAQVIQRSELENELQKQTLKRTNLLSALEENRFEVSIKQGESESVSKKLQQALLDKLSWESASKQRDNLKGDIEKDRASLIEQEDKIRQRKDLENDQEAQEREKSTLSKNLGRVQQEIALCKHKIDELKTHLSLLQSTESAECPTCRRSLSEIEKNNVETDYINDEQTWANRLRVAQADEFDTTKTLAQIDGRLNEIQPLLRRLPTEIQVEELNQTIKNKEPRLNDLQEQINLLSEAPKAVESLQLQVDNFDRAIKDLKHIQEELEKQRSQHYQIIDQLQRDISELPTVPSEKTLEIEIQRLEEKVKVQNSTAEKLANAEQDLQKALAELGELGDPRTEQFHLNRVIARRSELVKDRASTLEEKRKATISKADFEKALLPFANLVQEISETKSILREFEQDHKIYERNIQTAETLGKRQISFDNLQQQHTDETAKLDQLVADKNEVKVGYDLTYHQEIRSDFSKLEADINSKSTRLDEWEKQLELLNTELSELEQQQEELERVEAEVCRLEKLSGIFDFIRNSIQRASPDIVRRRVQAVSQTADRIFQDILGDLMLTLVWDESYAVKVRSGQKERVFEQLSGGEQMAASIAVRLALLLHMADNNIRWLFLDEPTANMDDLRREKLADRITRLDQLDQIFVITHDDAFDRDTHHLIQISKSNGVSTVTNIR